MSAPDAWLVTHASCLPPSGRALDLACGLGRHALWLARQGYRTTAIDRDTGALAQIADAAAADGLDVTVEPHDLEDGSYTLPAGAWDVIVVSRYLHRPLMPALRAALRPGGVLVYQTFTAAQAARGHPRNPAFLLQPGELVRLVEGLDVLDRWEGVDAGQCLSGVVARRPSG